MKIAVVSPAYNEERIINRFLDNISKLKMPLYVVDDGSVDDTYKILSKYKMQGRKCEILRHEVNLGKGAAMKTGAEAAFLDGFEAVVFIDSDGQHDVEELPKFIKKLEEGYDVVFGKRDFKSRMPFVRLLGNKLASFLISVLFKIKISDILCGYRAITKKAYNKLKWESLGYEVETEMVIRVAKNGLKYCEVPVSTLYLDAYKGVSLIDSFGIFLNVLRWRIVL